LASSPGAAFYGIAFGGLIHDQQPIRIVSALTVIADGGDFTRFPSAKRLSSFTGLRVPWWLTWTTFEHYTIIMNM
jgi:hypothetical protein